MRKQRTTYLGRQFGLSAMMQFRDPVVLTRIATIVFPLYLTLMLGPSVRTFALAVVLMVAGLAASTEFSRPDTYADRLARTYRNRQLDKRDRLRRGGNESVNGDRR
ncbi:hypothetical protein [Rhodococcus sp. UFZ-B548]|uniref:hypothetical protein n=1 Tax=Rhodococcus sp. UFZ-B548 TaxID=2742212 RepID=UPI0015F5852A|nr:hypothetical protein [Rhodococcus sp. UFZ-B548]